MKTSSCKAKGRRLQDHVSQEIRDKLSLSVLDVRPAIMGQSGRDIKLSEHAESLFPFDVECKNVEKLNLWGSWNQCLENTKVNRKPLLVFSRNRSDVLCTLRFSDLLWLLDQH